MALDLYVTRKNKKGQVTSESPYVLYVENGIRVFERPPGSGEFFYENGETIKAEHRPAAAALQSEKVDEKSKAEDRAALRSKVRDLNKKVKEHDKSEGADRNEAPELTDADQEALDSLLNETK